MSSALIIASLANLCITMAGASAFILSPVMLDQYQANKSDIGNIESTVESLSYIFRVLSGYISDMLKNRKIFLLLSYTIGILGKLLLVSSNSIADISYARIVDRIGNGLAASPREALIGNITSGKSNIGLLFGIKYILQYTGSLISSLVLYYTMNCLNITYSLWIMSVIPSIIGVILILFLKEKTYSISKVSFYDAIQSIDKKFIYVLILIFIFKLGYYSGAFYFSICKAQGLKTGAISIIMLIQNIATVITTLPAAHYSDIYSRKYMFILGSIVLLLSHLCFYITDTLYISLFGILLYGVQIGITHNIISTIIVNCSKKEYLGFNFGISNIVIALSVFLSNRIIGIFEHGFLILVICALFAIILSILILDE